jgi:archaetidylinositol phosphate synthase
MSRQRGLLSRSRKQSPTRELLCEWGYRPLAHLMVLALLPLRVPPPAVVLASGAAGIAAAVELARGDLGGAALLLVVKTVFDNADGQLARASGRVSALGRYLDSEVDLLVNAALFAALGYSTQQPLLALATFLVLTFLLSANFNLRRLHELERGRAVEAMPAADGTARLLRRIYQLAYAPQDRAVERFVRWRVGRLRSGPAARLVYHDRAMIAVLHNLGLSGQMTALALCLALGRPQLEFWLVLACGLVPVPLELRRAHRAARFEKAGASLPLPAQL